MMGMCGGRKIATNMGNLLQDRYRARIMLHRGVSLPGLDFEKGREFRFSIVDV